MGCTCSVDNDIDDGRVPTKLSINAKHLAVYDNLNKQKNADTAQVEASTISAPGESVEQCSAENTSCKEEHEEETELKNDNSTGEIAEDSKVEVDDPLSHLCMEGNLKKKSPALLSGWQMRYCVLQADSLFSYYGSEIDFRSNREAKGCINLNDITRAGKRHVAEEGTAFIFLAVEGRIYEFEAEDEQTARKWHTAIISHFPAGSPTGSWKSDKVTQQAESLEPQQPEQTEEGSAVDVVVSASGASADGNGEPAPVRSDGNEVTGESQVVGNSPTNAVE